MTKTLIHLFPHEGCVCWGDSCYTVRTWSDPTQDRDVGAPLNRLSAIDFLSVSLLWVQIRRVGADGASVRVRFDIVKWKSDSYKRSKSHKRCILPPSATVSPWLSGSCIYSCISCLLSQVEITHLTTEGTYSQILYGPIFLAKASPGRLNAPRTRLNMQRESAAAEPSSSSASFCGSGCLLLSATNLNDFNMLVSICRNHQLCCFWTGLKIKGKKQHFSNWLGF